MNRRNILTLSAIAAMGLTLPPSNIGAQQGTLKQQLVGTATIPDFSGLWDHGFPGFEPLASGPTALVNRLRRPDGTGNNARGTVGDYTNPILKPEAAEVVKKYGELALNGQGQPHPQNQCWPGGPPYDFTELPMLMLQTANHVIILYEVNHQVRHVRMNQSHPADAVILIGFAGVAHPSSLRPSPMTATIPVRSRTYLGDRSITRRSAIPRWCQTSGKTKLSG